MEYFDTHSHYHQRSFSGDIELYMQSLFSKGVRHILTLGTDLKDSKSALSLTMRMQSFFLSKTFSPSAKNDSCNMAFPGSNITYPHVWAGVGIHPQYLPQVSDDCPVEVIRHEYIQPLRKLCQNPLVRAIGETGLDYRHCKKDSPEAALQRLFFEEHLILSEELHLPVSVHSLRAAEDTMKLIRSHPNAWGVLHGYSGSKEQALEYTSRGWYIGIGANIINPRGRRLREVVKTVSPERILWETDAPFTKEYSSTTASTSSGYLLSEIAENLASITGIPLQELSAIIYHNSLKLFSVPLSSQNPPKRHSRPNPHETGT